MNITSLTSSRSSWRTRIGNAHERGRGPAGPDATGRVERASADDLTSLATDVGSAPMHVGAVLILETPTGFDGEHAVTTFSDRVRSIPRLRQRLVNAPFGCGRAVWVDDPDFDVSRHVRTVECPGAGDEQALLDVAASEFAARLSRDQPLWSATFVTGLPRNRIALVFVFHHVLADGIGGLAVLAQLVDGTPNVQSHGFPSAAPSTFTLALDAWRARGRALVRVSSAASRLREAVTEVRAGRSGRAPRSSLNRPTGARREYAVVRTQLDRVHAVAQSYGATVNDVVLAAVTASLHELLESRGEYVDRFVVSIPMSGRARADVTDLGNHVGAVPVGLVTIDDPVRRLESIAEVTREAKRAPRGASTALLGPVFRVLARFGIFHWCIDRQHLVNTFVTNVRGPDARLSFASMPIVDMLPVGTVTGNVTVSFAVLSYAGNLAITIICDPEVCSDLRVLRNALDEQLSALTRLPRPPVVTPGRP